MEKHIDAMLRLVKSEICNTPFEELTPELCTDDFLKKLYDVSQKHDLAHLVGSSLYKSSLLGKDEISEKFTKKFFTAAYRYEKLSCTFTELCAEFEKSEIPFMPLKGSVIREYYPEPWMRTSCDIDILIRKEDLDRATDRVVAGLKYRNVRIGGYDVSFVSPLDVHVELHYDFIERDMVNSSGEVLGDVWNDSHVKYGCKYCYEMTDEMLYYYHVAHMAKHIKRGGCGVRPFVDLWILEHCVEHDADKRDSLLQKGDLLRFANVARRLCEVWFGDAEHTDATKQLEEYTVLAGAYGSLRNHLAITLDENGGRFRYILSRIFMPYSQMKHIYPILLKHPWLMPFYQVRRWILLPFKGKMKHYVKEVKINMENSPDKREHTKQMLEKLGL